MGGGLADRLNAAFWPSALMLALAALKIRSDASIHNISSYQKVVPERRRCPLLKVHESEV